MTEEKLTSTENVEVAVEEQVEVPEVKKETKPKRKTTRRKTTTKKTPTRGTNTKAKTSSGRVSRGRPKKDVEKTPVKDLPWDKMLISEMLQQVSSAKTKAQKVELLKKWKCPALTKILVINYNPNIVSELPEGDVPYTPNEAIAGTEHLSLHIEQRKLHYFFKGGYPGLKQLKREQMFIRLLEGLHADDANLLVHVKDKKLQELYRITAPVVIEAYPEFEKIVN